MKKRFNGLILVVAMLFSALTCGIGEAAVSKVFMTSGINPERLAAVYKALEWTPVGRVAVKITTGEPPNSNYLRVELIGDLVKSLNGTFVECNTAYGGSRASAAMHLQVAKDHGYTKIAAVDIQDAEGAMNLSVKGGTRISEHIVGASFKNYDSYLVFSHFKGHQIAGYGGAVKNISIGMASVAGKYWIHTGGGSKSGWTPSNGHESFLEAMGDAGKAVQEALGENTVWTTANQFIRDKSLINKR
jgi:uncharacterized Fe-S center protein